MFQSRLLADIAPVASPFLRRLFRSMAIPGFLLLLTGCGGGGSSSTPHSYSVQELKSASQVNSIQPGGVNNSGQVVGSLEHPGSDPDSYHAFLYANGPLQDISSQPGVKLQQAIAINDAGQILCRGVYQADLLAVNRAFLYLQGKAVDLDPAAASPHNAAAINASGQIAGDNFTHVALYTKGAWQDLGAPPGAISVTATCLNTQGDIAGNFYDANQISHVFLYKNGTFTDVDAVASGYNVNVVGIDDSDAITFNASVTPMSGSSGLVAGAAKGAARARATSNPNVGVFVWDVARGVQALPVPANADVSAAFVSAVNRRGDILGGYYVARDTSAAETIFNAHLLVWHNRSVTDITPLIPTLDAWNLQTAYAPTINDRGQILAMGTASQSNGLLVTGPSAYHTFTLTPQ